MMPVRHVVELLQAQGVAVRALVRDKTKVDKVKAKGQMLMCTAR